MVISHLLDAGVDFKSSLQFFGTKYEPIISSLDNGVAIEDILANQNDAISKNMIFFLHYSSMKNAIANALSIVELQEKLKKELVAKLSYPTLIMIVCIALIKLFYQEIFPMLLSSFPNLEQNTLIIVILRIFYGFTWCLQYSFILLCIILLIASLSSQFQYLLIHHLVRYLPMLKQYCSYVFGHYLLILNEAGISTIDGLEYLKKLNHIWIQKLANTLVVQLNQGDDFLSLLEKNRYITNPLYQALQLRFHTQENNQPLQIFLTQQQEYWKLEVKKMTIIVYAITYLFVAIIVLLMFQFMLLPFDLLSTMG